MKVEDTCKVCEKEMFLPSGRAKVIGFVPFECANCKEHSLNYAGGQPLLCHACSRKLGRCVFCGKVLT